MTQAINGNRPPRDLRAVFISHSAQRAGGELALLQLVEMLPVKAHVILGEPGPIHDRYIAAGLSVEVIEMPAPIRGFVRNGSWSVKGRILAVVEVASYIRLLRDRLRELDPDVVHANSLKSGLCGAVAARFAGVPCVWHVREPLTNFGRVWQAVLRLAMTTLPSALVANSQSTLSSLGRRGQRRARVVRSPVKIHSAPQRAARSGQPMRIGMIGRLSPSKGQDVFLKAFAAVARESEVEALIAGEALFDDGGFEEELEELADRLGVGDCVRFLGYQEDVDKILSELDIFVHASVRAEGFGQAIVQAMIAGIPVVVTRLGAPTEYVIHGENGLLVTAGSAEELAGALTKLIFEPQLRAALGSRARAIRDEIDPARITEEVLELYGEVAGRSR